VPAVSQPTWSIRCAHCNQAVAADVVSGWAYPNMSYEAAVARVKADRRVLWLRCPSCGEGSVRASNGVISPPAPAGRRVAHLPPEVDQAWREARTAHSVAAYTASEMMLRKILMHVAVDKCSSAPGKGFVDYVDDLSNAGYITTGLKDVVDRIRKRGNVANHELPPSTEQDSLLTMTITEHLLEGMYELPGMAAPAIGTNP
jgi:Domain of unknown function (DUF4145)